MNKIRKWFKETLWKIWEGVLQNVSTIIFAFVVSGGYLVVINKVQQVQKVVKQIPTDYVLTPLVLLLIIVVVLLRINHKQRVKISDVERQPPSDERDARFITHLGVWWRIYLNSEYIEDFPYCPCCEPKKKLVQIEWYPDEKYKCPITNTEIQLYDEISRKRSDVLKSLYSAYFHSFSGQTMMQIHKELNKYRELYPDADKSELLKYLFTIEPLNSIPENEQGLIRQRFDNPLNALFFIEHNYDTYKKYFKRKKNEV